MASAKMQVNPSRRLRRGRAKTQAGQSLIIALSILFLLGFLGALFAGIVVRNLQGAQASNETINTDYFAQSGINYANYMLQNSPMGADWRPPLQYLDSVDTYGTNVTPALVAVNSLDPDSEWLKAGYTRYNTNGGRFLLKVTYAPYTLTAASPTSKYIRIDSVGRIGIVNSQDPTTFTQTPPDFRRSELTAYKPIGIVDYSRFITNKDKRTDTATLGMPSIEGPNSTAVTPGVYDFTTGTNSTSFAYTELPLVTTYGSQTGYSNLLASTTPAAGQVGGGSLRSNMGLRLYGVNLAYLNTAFGDRWEVAGNLTFDNYDATTANGGTSLPASTYRTLPAQFFVYTDNPQNINAFPPGVPMFPSNDTNFTSVSGAVRDGNASNDLQGYPRQIKRLNPPVIDTVDPASNLTRYQALTAGAEVQTQQYATSADFKPATVSVNNDTDIQRESLNTLLGHSLRNDWVNHASDTGGSWVGSYYNPPGALITFGPLAGLSNSAFAFKTGQPTSPYGITLTRSDGNQFTGFTTGGTATQVGQTLLLSYGPLPNGITANPDVNGVGYLDADQQKVPNDIVIHTTGNIRVRGIISDPTQGSMPKHITIVTDGIAYIDGSILKGNPQSSIAILAKQYVCVNTTQFTGGAIDFANSPSGISGSDGPPSALTFATSETLTEHALYGANYANPNATYTPALYVTQSAGGVQSTSEGDATVNGALPQLQLGSLIGGQTVSNVYGSLTTPLVNPPVMGVPFDLKFNKDTLAVTDWMLVRAAVLPGDIDIEAVLYAQDGSFFVIPGDWFNTNSNDTMSAAPNRAQNINTVLDPRFPLYGQPIDLKITINGAVTENIPANISDQAAWMQKWGWIPQYHGTDLTDESPHSASNNMSDMGVAVGLNLTYDPLAGYPYMLNGTNPPTYLRQDRFGRPLPFAPSLPVSPDLLYSGQPLAN